LAFASAKALALSYCSFRAFSSSAFCFAAASARAFCSAFNASAVAPPPPEPEISFTFLLSVVVVVTSAFIFTYLDLKPSIDFLSLSTSNPKASRTGAILLIIAINVSKTMFLSFPNAFEIVFTTFKNPFFKALKAP